MDLGSIPVNGKTINNYTIKTFNLIFKTEDLQT